MNLDEESLLQIHQDLNEASDELSKIIVDINQKLKGLSLGISVWVNCQDGIKFGYAKINNKWGLGIMYDTNEIRHFNEAPRWYRVIAIDILERLPVKVTQSAKDLTQLIKDKIVFLQSIKFE